MFIEGNVYPDEYVPYRVNIDILDDDFKRLLLGQSFKEEYINLVDKSGYLGNNKGFDVNNGAEVGVSSAKSSWFLPVEYGKLYVGNFWNYNYGACYDVNKNYLCSIMDGIATLGSAKYPFYLKRNDLKYIRVAFSSTVTPYVAEGTALPNVIIPKENQIKFISDYFKNWIKKDLNVNRPLSGLKWNVLGDSITAAPGKTRNYHSIIGEQENIFVRNYGISGSRIMVGSGGTAGSEMVNRYSSMDDDADIITCFGGINDMNNNLPLGTMSDRIKESFYGALNLLLSGLITKYLGKRIGFIAPLNYGNPSHEPYHTAIQEVCKYYSIPLLDLHKDGLINTVITDAGTFYFSDGLHPTEQGHDVLARKIRQFIMTL
jgi:lysophospholipase L1-like esterase